MVNHLGIPGTTWSLIFQIVAISMSLFLGAVGRRRGLWAAAVSLGLGANVIGQLILAGGGPGACAGFVLLPVYCLVTAYAALGVRMLILEMLKQRDS